MKSGRIKSFYLIMLAVVGTVSGCVTVELNKQQTKLSYPPEEIAFQWGKQSAAARLLPPSSQPLKPISLIKFEDTRAEKKVLGTARRGIELQILVVKEQEVSKWVTNAIKLHLEEAGYQVTELTEKSGRETGWILSGAIEKLSCSGLLSYEAEIVFRAQLEKEGKEIFNKQYLARGKTGSNLEEAGLGHSGALSWALYKAIDQLMADLDKASATL